MKRDRQTDDRRSDIVTLAFSSGELIIIYIVVFVLSYPCKIWRKTLLATFPLRRSVKLSEREREGGCRFCHCRYFCSVMLVCFLHIFVVVVFSVPRGLKFLRFDDKTTEPVKYSTQ